MTASASHHVSIAAIAARLAQVKMRLSIATGGDKRPPAIAIALGRAPLGNHVVDQPARCPACGGSAWHVGRITAECAGCGLPLHVQQAPLAVL